MKRKSHLTCIAERKRKKEKRREREREVKVRPTDFTRCYNAARTVGAKDTNCKTQSFVRTQ